MRALLLAAAALMTTAAAAWCQLPGEQPYGAVVYGSPVRVASSEPWTYTVCNTSPDQNYTIWLVQIEVDEATEVTNVFSPAGWAADLEEPHFVTWICTEGELGAGQEVEGFVAEFSSQPTYQSWCAMFNNIADPWASASDGGIVMVIPEPGSISVLVVGLASLAASKRRGRA